MAWKSILVPVEESANVKLIEPSWSPALTQFRWGNPPDTFAPIRSLWNSLRGMMPRAEGIRGSLQFTIYELLYFGICRWFDSGDGRTWLTLDIWWCVVVRDKSVKGSEARLASLDACPGCSGHGYLVFSLCTTMVLPFLSLSGFTPVQWNTLVEFLGIASFFSVLYLNLLHRLGLSLFVRRLLTHFHLTLKHLLFPRNSPSASLGHNKFWNLPCDGIQKKWLNIASSHNPSSSGVVLPQASQPLSHLFWLASPWPKAVKRWMLVYWMVPGTGPEIYLMMTKRGS
jgi:hypothetical protein